MDPELCYGVFDWKHTGPILAFMTDVTKDEPLCFRVVDSEDDAYFNIDESCYGSDVYVVVYGPKPISQQEANVFYRAVLDYEAELEAKRRRKKA